MADLPITGVNIAYLTALIATVVVVILIYRFFLRPTGQFALPGEEDEGTWKIGLPSLGRFNEGRVNPAYDYLQKQWSKLITNCAEPTEKENLITTRDEMMKKHYIHAQRSGRSKILYFFDQDPLLPQYHIRESVKGELIKWIGPIQDAESEGEWKGWEVITVKLKTTNVSFTTEEREKLATFRSAAKFMALAATNVEALRHTKDERDRYKDLHAETLKDLAKERSEKDRAVRALALKSLTSPTGEAPKTGLMGAIAKSFFTGWQLFFTAIAFIITPSIVKWGGYTILDPTSVSIAASIIVFLAYPLVKGLMQRG